MCDFLWNSWLDFNGDVDYNEDTGILKGIFTTVGEGSCKNFTVLAAFLATKYFRLTL